MRIFLSYAREDGPLADEVRIALQGDGHDVYFDREDVVPGEEFHTSIRKGVEASDLLVFLASPKSLDSGSYTLTEISIAQSVWPVPDGRVLPVLLQKVEVRDLPVYLRSVTFLECPGNVPGAVAHAVDQLARKRRRRRWRSIVPIAVACLVAAAATTWYFANRGMPASRAGKDGAPAMLVPAGDFTMGDDENSPIRKLYVDAFYMDRFEITTSRYRKFLEGTGSGNTPDYWDEIAGENSDEMPVVGVSWNEANAYCRWAGRRLPTETEWEKSARGADQRTYPWGNVSPDVIRANYENSSPDTYSTALHPAGKHPTGKSPYGVEDMAGNAAEWVADWYSESFTSDDVYNPRGPTEGEKKVIRGGGRYDPPFRLITSARQFASPENRLPDLGFRCASDP